MAEMTLSDFQGQFIEGYMASAEPYSFSRLLLWNPRDMF